MRFTRVRRDSTAISALIHIISIYVLVYVLDYNYRGVCIATSISLGSRFIIASYLVKCIEATFEPEVQAISFFSKATFRNLYPQVKLGIGSAGMSVWGYWALDIFTLMASYLSVEAIAAQTIMRSIGMYSYMLPVALATTASTLIGNSIGAESKPLIFHYYKVLIFMAFLVGLMEAGLLYLTRDYVIALFADEQSVKSEIEYIWWIFLMFVITDAVSSVSANSVRATGR